VAFYVSDGSSTEKKIGAGIVRSEGFSKAYYAFTANTRSHQSVGAECFAIHKAVQLMNIHGDRQATLVTDFKHIIDLYEGIRIPVRPVPPWVIRALNDLKEIRARGVHLTLRHRSDLPPILDYASSHRLSRAYKWAEPPIDYDIDPHAPPAPVAIIDTVCPDACSREKVFFENRHIVQDWRLPKAMAVSSPEQLRFTSGFIFQQTAGRRWVVLDDRKEPCVIGRSLVDVLATVFYAIEPCGEPVRVNEHAMYLLKTVPPEEQDEAYYTVVSRMTAFPISVFADFPLLNHVPGIEHFSEVAAFGPSRPLLG
jgi:hypothetical protein